MQSRTKEIETCKVKLLRVACQPTVDDSPVVTSQIRRLPPLDPSRRGVGFFSLALQSGEKLVHVVAKVLAVERAVAFERSDCVTPVLFGRLFRFPSLRGHPKKIVGRPIPLGQLKTASIVIASKRGVGQEKATNYACREV